MSTVVLVAPESPSTKHNRKVAEIGAAAQRRLFQTANGFTNQRVEIAGRAFLRLSFCGGFFFRLFQLELIPDRNGGSDQAKKYQDTTQDPHVGAVQG